VLAVQSEPQVSRAAMQEQLQEVFAAFASFGTRASSDGASEVDGQKFAKLCRECHLLSGSFNSTSVDIIFSRVKGKVGSFAHMRGERGFPLCKVVASMCICGYEGRPVRCILCL